MHIHVVWVCVPRDRQRVHHSSILRALRSSDDILYCRDVLSVLLARARPIWFLSVPIFLFRDTLLLNRSCERGRREQRHRVREDGRERHDSRLWARDSPVRVWDVDKGWTALLLSLWVHPGLWLLVAFGFAMNLDAVLWIWLFPLILELRTPRLLAVSVSRRCNQTRWSLFLWCRLHRSLRAAPWRSLLRRFSDVRCRWLVSSSNRVCPLILQRRFLWVFPNRSCWSWSRVACLLCWSLGMEIHPWRRLYLMGRLILQTSVVWRGRQQIRDDMSLIDICSSFWKSDTTLLLLTGWCHWQKLSGMMSVRRMYMDLMTIRRRRVVAGLSIFLVL